jgi:hypothetical protein
VGLSIGLIPETNRIRRENHLRQSECRMLAFQTWWLENEDLVWKSEEKQGIGQLPADWRYFS